MTQQVVQNLPLSLLVALVSHSSNFVPTALACGWLSRLKFCHPMVRSFDTTLDNLHLIDEMTAPQWAGRYFIRDDPGSQETEEIFCLLRGHYNIIFYLLWSLIQQCSQLSTSFIIPSPHYSSQPRITHTGIPINNPCFSSIYHLHSWSFYFLNSLAFKVFDHLLKVEQNCFLSKLNHWFFIFVFLSSSTILGQCLHSLW